MTAGREPIFDDIAREVTSPAQHSESTYAFLNRVPGEYWEHARRLMQSWADRLRADRDYNDIRQRLRSRDDYQFRSAFLELYLHEALTRSGHTVLIHPVVPGAARRPDFRAERGDDKFYVEAIAPGATPKAKAAAKRRAVLFDTVDRVGDPNFMLWLDHLEEGPTPPAAARLRADLRRWLAQLDPDTILNLESAPSWNWRQCGWSVTFKAIPKRPDARVARSSDRAIGVFGHTEASIIDNAPTIRNALSAKHNAYGDLDAPFLVAVGTYMFDTDRWHSTNALYGRAAVQLIEDADGEIITREVRQPDGYFGVPPEWQNRIVSGVLLVNQLMPYSVHTAEITLWRHPDALHPLPSDVGLPGTTLTLTSGRLIETSAQVTARALFDLPDPWPPGDPWPDDTWN